ncbi:heptaprenyl diphosphate synthase [Bacillus mesophilus]|uniref:Heptaprenyl diphosphate synthase component 1 n=1 Tax=Bacillus mesophilus TaxID=1808955 RepID=A0A6M0Q4R2_9BACI|nr:heptaprenyl diphosphate synthase [Bacillus mesophilus]NEY71232.1 heptaprenyl diphosphate synthase component 1 [Bacillus mesophilus]
MNDINRKKTYILEKINQFIHHSYLNKFIDTPKVDEDKLFLLVAMCNDAEIDDKTLETYIITTILVQVALDVHEEVSTAEKLGDLEQKKQQLKVLAGDYFSGLYYSLLSQIEDITMIKSIAHCIKLINEHKIRVYRQDSSYGDTIVDSLKIIEGELFINIANTFGLSNWKSLLLEILLLKRLYKEKGKYIETGHSVMINFLNSEARDLNSSASVTKLDVMIMNTRERIQNIISSSTIDSAILERIHLIINKVDIQPVHSILEEG